MYDNFLCLIAGMPSVLPEDVSTVLRLNEDAVARLQSISFFLFALMAATITVWALWNFVARDTKWLPKISFAKASCLVFLWSALFVIVLTMISGARELLTPGAWKKVGVTYTLDNTSNKATSDSDNGQQADAYAFENKPESK